MKEGFILKGNVETNSDGTERCLVIKEVITHFYSA
jgi:hypothetical protein